MANVWFPEPNSTFRKRVTEGDIGPGQRHFPTLGNPLAGREFNNASIRVEPGSVGPVRGGVKVVENGRFEIPVAVMVSGAVRLA